MSKPGFKSTEFYLTLIKGSVGPVLAVLVASGMLTPEVTEDEVTRHIEQIAAGLIALVGLFVSGSAVKTYTEARTGIKIHADQAPDILESQIGFHIPEDEEYDDEDSTDAGFTR